MNNIEKFNQYDSLGYKTDLELYKDINHLKQDTLNIKYFSQNRIRGNIELKTTKLLYLSIPYDRGWNALIDSKKVKPLLCNIGFMGLIIQPGKHNIELYYRPPFFIINLIISIIGLVIFIVLIFLYRNFYLRGTLLQINLLSIIKKVFR